jgi:hypothetical protein
MPENVPPNAGFMIAAYTAAAVILVGYAVLLYRRTLKP